MPRCLIVGHESDLAGIITQSLLTSGWEIISTSRRTSNVFTNNHFHCNLADAKSIDLAIEEIFSIYDGFDLVVVCVGQLSPIGPLVEMNYLDWSNSILLNSVNQVYLISQILKRLKDNNYAGTKFLTFAGSGTNSAPVNFSAYTIAKISLIKAMELFASECPEYVFASLGTGWMKSAIHQQTISAGEDSGPSYFETLRRIEHDDFGDPQLLSEFIFWFLNKSKDSTSGRNIALQGDDWKSGDFINILTSSIDSYKLRRAKGMR
jgi:NAD(P)-dependent dehydrogenase (short-subunit alcohol dehydrogenase family)